MLRARELLSEGLPPVSATLDEERYGNSHIAHEQSANTAPLPEAPVSITLKATLHGHEVLVTLRGTDFASVKVQVEAASAWLQAQTPAQASSDPPQCPTHRVPMKLNHGKDGHTWYSHKTADGWCKGQ